MWRGSTWSNLVAVMEMADLGTIVIWVRSRNCDCLVTWFCYQLIAKPGNKTAAVSWRDPYPYDVIPLFIDTNYKWQMYFLSILGYTYMQNSVGICKYFLQSLCSYPVVAKALWIRGFNPKIQPLSRWHNSCINSLRHDGAPVKSHHIQGVPVNGNAKGKRHRWTYDAKVVPTSVLNRKDLQRNVRVVGNAHIMIIMATWKSGKASLVSKFSLHTYDTCQNIFNHEHYDIFVTPNQ